MSRIAVVNRRIRRGREKRLKHDLPLVQPLAEPRPPTPVSTGPGAHRRAGHGGARSRVIARRFYREGGLRCRAGRDDRGNIPRRDLRDRANPVNRSADPHRDRLAQIPPRLLRFARNDGFIPA